MRHLTKLLLTIFISANAFAQALPIRNDTPTTLRDLGANLNVGRNFAVDQYGRLQCIMPAGTTNSPVKLEDSVAADGDAGIPAWAVRNEGAAVLAGSNLDYSAIAVNREGAIYVSTSTLLNDATNGKLAVVDEDTAFAASDALTKAGGVNNRSASVFNATNGDVTPFGVNDYGSIFVDLSGVNLLNPENTPVRLEDAVFGAANGVMVAGGQSLSAIAQSVGTSGDVAPIAMDLGNRLVTTNAPAGETWYACTGEITTATNTSLKGLVASNRHYVTSFGCTATSTNPNQIYLTDGSGGTAMAFVNTTSNAVAPGPHQTYPVPLRGSSGVALFVTTITTGAVRCCAAGYISTI